MIAEPWSLRPPSPARFGRTWSCKWTWVVCSNTGQSIGYVSPYLAAARLSTRRSKTRESLTWRYTAASVTRFTILCWTNFTPTPRERGPAWTNFTTKAGITARRLFFDTTKPVPTLPCYGDRYAFVLYMSSLSPKLKLLGSMAHTISLGESE